MTPDEIMKMEGIAPELRKVLADMASDTTALDARVLPHWRKPRSRARKGG